MQPESKVARREPRSPTCYGVDFQLNSREERERGLNRAECLIAKRRFFILFQLFCIQLLFYQPI